MKDLEKEHAEIRLSTFQVLDQLFQRSHSLRQLLCADFQKIISLGINIRVHIILIKVTSRCYSNWSGPFTTPSKCGN